MASPRSKALYYVLSAIPFALSLAMFGAACFGWLESEPGPADDPFTRDRLLWVLNGPERRAIQPPDLGSSSQILAFYVHCLEHKEEWTRVRAARVLAQDMRYAPARQKILHAARRTKNAECRADLLYWLGEIARPDCVDSILWFYHNDPEAGVRYDAIRALRNVRTRRVQAFLIDRALHAADRDDAYAAACILAEAYDGTRTIHALEAYLHRPDAEKRTIACLSIPVRVQMLKNQQIRFWVKLVGLVVLVAGALVLARWLTPPRRSVAPLWWVGGFTEVALLVLLGLWDFRTMLAAVGGGDAGAFNPQFLHVRSMQQCILLGGLYLLGVVWLAIFFRELVRLRQAKPAGRRIVPGWLAFSLFLANTYILLTAVPFSWIIPVG